MGNSLQKILSDLNQNQISRKPESNETRYSTEYENITEEIENTDARFDVISFSTFT